MIPVYEIVGIDLGQAGAIVVITNEKTTVTKMPETAEAKATAFANLFSVNANVYIEDLHAMPESFRGTISNFASGYNKGVVEGILSAQGHIGINWVSAQAWQKPWNIPSKKALNMIQADYYQYKKKYLKELAIKVFPTIVGITLWSCDALLIADYGLKQEVQKGLKIDKANN